MRYEKEGRARPYFVAGAGSTDEGLGVALECDTLSGCCEIVCRSSQLSGKEERSNDLDKGEQNVNPRAEKLSSSKL